MISLPKTPASKPDMPGLVIALKLRLSSELAKGENAA